MILISQTVFFMIDPQTTFLDTGLAVTVVKT